MPHSPSAKSDIAKCYFLLQGIAGAIWWVALGVHAGVRAYFTPPGFEDWFLAVVLIPDLLFFVTGSLVTALHLHRKRPTATLWAACTFGATAYATLMTLGLAIVRDYPWPPGILMAVAACASLGAMSSAVRRSAAGEP